MRTVRRVYFYLLALIGSQAIIWGAVNLLRTVVAGRFSGTVGTLANGLSLVLVGVPVFLLHWLTAQREAQQDEEERASRIRAIFLHAVRVWTLIPILYAALALLNRFLAGVMGLSESGAFFGAGQTTSDNLIAIAVNLAAYQYFTHVLSRDWQDAPAGHFLAETRRLYRYLWVLFGLTLTVFGVQGTLSYLLSLLQGVAAASGYRLATSLSLLLVGTPVWGVSWWLAQESLDENAERESILRLVVLYLICLAGVVGVLAAGGRTLAGIFGVWLGRPQSLPEFLFETGPALSALVPLAVMWAYYGRILEREMAALASAPQRAGVRRLYRSLLSALGLATLFMALFTLLGYVVDGLLTWNGVIPAWGKLNTGLATLAVGLPLWLATWLPLQAEAGAAGEIGERARRSVVRRAYLYLFVFLFVVGLMVAAGDLFYNLITHFLGSPIHGIGALAAKRSLFAVALAVFLVYHLRVLRADARAAQQAQSKTHAAFPILLVVLDEMPLAEELVRALHRQTPRLPVAVHSLERGAPDDAMLSARLVVLPSRLALEPPEVLRLWLSAYRGRRLVVPQPLEGWVWPGATTRSLRELAEEAAGVIRQMAEGDLPRAGLPSNPWAVAGYVLGGLFAVQLLIGLFALLVSSLFG
jgi:hypothetical protein